MNPQTEAPFDPKAKAAANPQANAPETDPQTDPQIQSLLEPFKAWLAGIAAQQPAPWTNLPDIGLYMDQVVTYIDRQLALHRSSVKEHVVTSAMVNNYIKDGLLPRADLKKYAPTHLALLTMIGALKPVLSMQDLQILLGRDSNGRSVPESYARFLEGQKSAIAATAAQVTDQLQQLENASPEPDGIDVQAELRRIALDLAIEARVRILVAEQLLESVSRAERTAQSAHPAKAQAARPAEAGERNARRK